MIASLLAHAGHGVASPHAHLEAAAVACIALVVGAVLRYSKV